MLPTKKLEDDKIACRNLYSARAPERDTCIDAAEQKPNSTGQGIDLYRITPPAPCFFIVKLNAYI
jgi:hypothetical protein